MERIAVASAECDRSSGAIEHITLFECSLGNLLPAQLDHCPGEIDTVGFATASCNHGKAPDRLILCPIKAAVVRPFSAQNLIS